MVHSFRSQPHDAAPSPHWHMAAFLFTAAFINMLDTTITNLALPAIQTEFSAPDSGLQWTLVIYILTFATGLLPFGRFGDAFGRRQLFLVGLLGFLVASTACGFAPSLKALVATRFFQGLTAAMMMPQVLAILHESFPEDEKAKAIGIFGMVTALGAMAGPLVGGFLISADLWGLGWRMIFLINLPFGLIALAGAYVYVPQSAKPKAQNVDWLGAALFAIAALALLYPMIEGQALGWPIWLAGLFALSVASGVALLRLQYRRAANGQQQLIPISLLTNSSFLARVAIVMLMFSGIAGPIVVLAMVLQFGIQLSPDRAGLALAAHPLSVMVASILSSRLGSRFLERRVTLGIVSLLIGMIVLHLIVAPGVSISTIWTPLVLIGAGAGTATVAMFQLVLREVPPSDAGAGSGALQAFQQIGIALGIALVGQVYFVALGDASTASSHVEALKFALWVPITVFATLSLISLRLKPKETNDATA